jgi:hypothetical protein
VLSDDILRALVVETEVSDAEALHAFDQRVTQLVKDHLCQAIIGVERAGGADGHDALPVRRGVDLRRAFDSEANALSHRKPNRVERIPIAVLGLSFHVEV